MTISDEIKNKEYLLERITICDSFTNDWVQRLQKEILILKEIEAEEMKVWEDKPLIERANEEAKKITEFNNKIDEIKKWITTLNTLGIETVKEELYNFCSTLLEEERT